MALYDDDHAFVCQSDTVTVPGDHLGWLEYIFSDAPALVAGKSYYVMVRAENDDAGSLDIQMAYDALADYTPPDGSEWDDEEDYVTCQTVHYEDATVAQASGPLFTGGGML